MSTQGPLNPDAAASAAPAAEPEPSRRGPLGPAALVWLLWMIVWGAGTLAWLFRLRAGAHASGVDYDDGVLYAQVFAVAITLLGVVMILLGRRVGLGLGLASLGALVCVPLYFLVFQPGLRLWIGRPLTGHLFGWAVSVANVVVLFALLRARRAPSLSEAPQA